MNPTVHGLALEGDTIPNIPIKTTRLDEILERRNRDERGRDAEVQECSDVAKVEN